MTTVCRACLKQGVKMKSLFAFGIIFGKKMSLKDVLLSCANLQISQKDGFPQTVCLNCIVQIEKAYSFRMMCEKNQEMLNEQNQVPCYGGALVESHSTGSSDISNDDDGDSIIATGNEQNVDEKKHIENLDKIVSVQNERIDYIPHLELKSKPQAQSLQTTSKIPSKQACAVKQYDRYICQFCKSSYKLKSSLELHLIRTHSSIPELDPATLVCNICKKKCLSADHYKRHMNFHKTGKEYHCDECGRDFSQQRTYVCHMFSHTGERPILCTKCGKTFKTKVDLKIHMRAHLNLFPYTCEICGKKFRYGTTLTIHKRRHAGEKPFECLFCDMKFVCSSQLKRHNRTHTGEKPFSCNICSKAFARSSALKVHSQTHTGEKPHICNKCNRGFSQAHCLRSHMKLHEKEVVEENNEGQIENDVKFEADVIIQEIEDTM